MQHNFIFIIEVQLFLLDLKLFCQERISSRHQAPTNYHRQSQRTGFLFLHWIGCHIYYTEKNNVFCENMIKTLDVFQKHTPKLTIFAEE